MSYVIEIKYATGIVGYLTASEATVSHLAECKIRRSVAMIRTELVNQASVFETYDEAVLALNAHLDFFNEPVLFDCPFGYSQTYSGSGRTITIIGYNKKLLLLL